MASPPPPPPPIFTAFVGISLIVTLVCLFMSLPLILIIFIAIFPFLLLIYISQSKLIKPDWLLPSTVETGLPTRIVGRAHHWYQGKITDPRFDYGLEFEPIEIPAECDMHGHEYILRAWYIPVKNVTGKQSQTVLVCVHGAGRDRRTFMRHAPILHAHGYAMILMDCREHGLSDALGHGISFGIREAHDVTVVCEYAHHHMQFKHVVAMGTSQGAGSCIIAATSEKGKHVIDAVIAENPFTSREQLMADLMHAVWGSVPSPLRPLHQLCVYLVVYIARVRLGLGITPHAWHTSIHSSHTSFATRALGIRHPTHRPNPIEMIAEIAPRPVFIMHGTGDAIIPHPHSTVLYAHAHEPKSLWIAPDAEHTALFDRYPKEWEEKVVEFLKQHQLTP